MAPTIMLLSLIAVASALVPMGRPFLPTARVLSKRAAAAEEQGGDNEGSNSGNEVVADDEESKALRERLERMFSADTNGELDTVASQATLSPTRRRREETEKTLIAALGTDEADDAIERLWHHWTHERGEAAYRRLLESDMLLGSQSPEELELASGKIAALIQDHPTWVEAINRQAIIRFLQGQYTESIQLCEDVLAVKPWHFGALSGIIMCHSRLGNADKARSWAERALPPPGKYKDLNGRVFEPRKIWVDRMVRELELRQKFLL